MLSVVYAECRKQTHHAVYRYSECQCDVCRHAECNGAGQSLSLPGKAWDHMLYHFLRPKFTNFHNM